MSDFRIRNQLLLAAVQGAIGSEAAPTPAANAIKVRFPIEYSPNFETLETDYVQESVSQSEPVVGGGNVGMNFAVEESGSARIGVSSATLILCRRSRHRPQISLRAGVDGARKAVACFT